MYAHLKSKTITLKNRRKVDTLSDNLQGVTKVLTSHKKSKLDQPLGTHGTEQIKQGAFF